MIQQISTFWQRLALPSAVIITLSIQMTVSMLGASIPVLAPSIASDRGLDGAMMTFYSPIICIGAFAMNFLVSALLQRIGGMGLSLVCIGLSSLGLLCLLIPSMALLVVAPVLIGLATGAMNPASSQVLGPRTTSRTAGLILSIKQTGVPLGGAAVGVLMPFLALRSGWQNAIIELVVVSGGLILLCLPTVRWLNGGSNSTSFHPYRPLGPLRQLLVMPNMLSILIAAMIFVGMQYCLRSFFILHLVSSVGFPLSVAGTAFATSQAAGMVGQVGWAVLSDRALTTPTVMSIIGVVMTLAAVLTAIITPKWPVAAVLVIAALYGISAAGFLPVVLAEVARRSPAGQVGVLTSGANLFLISGVLIGPLAFGAISAWLNSAAAFAALGACTLLVTILVASPNMCRRGDPSNDRCEPP
jgi:MFS family permease